MQIAGRILRLRVGEREIEVPIRIFSPERSGTGWSCRYEIGWPEGKDTRTCGGVDSVQALILALQMIGADIYTSTYHQSGALFFEASGRGYGFPVPESLRDLLIGEDAKFGA